MPVAFLTFSFLGLIFFLVRLTADPGAWPFHALGAGACLVVGLRNGRVLLANHRVANATSGPTSSSGGRNVSPRILREISDMATLDEALSSQRAVLFKHSTSCPISGAVIGDVLEFARNHPNWKTYVLKVIEQNELSSVVEERLRVPHESPQVLVIKDRQLVWDGSHYDITQDALNKHAAT